MSDRTEEDILKDLIIAHNNNDTEEKDRLCKEYDEVHFGGEGIEV
jgi:hypothetical protein